MSGVGLEFPQGFQVSASLRVDNVLQNATVNGTMQSGLTSGFVVPAGYTFCAVAISVRSNAARSAGSATFKVTDDGTVLANGPEATLNASNATNASGTINYGAEPMAAGSVVGVDSVADATWAPATADVDVVVFGILLPT